MSKFHAYSKGINQFTISAALALSSLSYVAPAMAQDDVVNLLWVQPMRGHPVHRLMQAGFMEKCAELGYLCEIVGDPSATNWDLAASIPLAEAALARTEFDGVAVYGPDPAVYTYMSDLAAEGFPVVTWHVLPEEGSVPGLAAAVGEDIVNAGYNAAMAMGEQLGGKGVIALTQGASNDTENTMTDAFRATIAGNFPDIAVLATEMEGFDPSAAEAKAVAILLANPEIVAAFGTTGNSIQTWAGAARKADREIVIIGMDYIRQNLDLIRDGEAYGLVAQPLYEESALVAELLGRIAQGETVDYLHPLPAPVITVDDLQPYYDMLDRAGQ